jgi:hypothetical protein
MTKLPSRLAYSSFVVEDKKILYVETPKVACSSIKTILRDLYPSECGSPHYMKDQSSMEMVVHCRSAHASRSLLDLSDHEIEEVLLSKGWLRFCIVRNPFRRLFSCWRDKVFLHEPGFLRTQSNLINYLRDIHDPVENFRAFTCWVINERSVNHHWQPMTSILCPELIAYTLVAKLEFLSTQIRPFLHRLGCGEDRLSKYKRNSSLPVPRAEYYNRQVAEEVYEYYRGDFAQYGYGFDTWREVGNTFGGRSMGELLFEPNEAGYYMSMISAIRQRNQVIAYLNDAA